MKTILNNSINQLVAFFTEKVNSPHAILLSQKFLYLFILASTLFYLPIANELWSADAMFIHYFPFKSYSEKMLNLISYRGIINYYFLFLVVQIVACIAILFNYKKYLMSAIVFITFSNLYNGAATIQNGGTNLLKLILFYAIFLNPFPKKYKNESSNVLAITLTNFSFLAIQIQICAVYFVAATTKLFGTYWLDGTAVYYVFNLPEFSHPAVLNTLTPTSIITKMLTWGTLTFQLLFPFFVWIKKLKKITLFIGLLFHLLIVLIMGITDFGLIMIMVYSFFMSDGYAEKLLMKSRLKS